MWHTPIKPTGTADCLRRSYKSDGIKGIYAGFGVSLFGAVIFRALFLGGYDVIKDVWGLQQASVFHRFCAAHVLTTVVGTLCFPVDTVKRRLMVQGSDIVSQRLSPTGAGGNIPKKYIPYKGAVDCLGRIVREEGVKGVFSGLGVNVVRGLAGSLLLVAYDELKLVIQIR
eukprot:CAMPEP_0173336038 /NCGR_PEP_ID=MMETSP1144-20121109/6313_1 /TAXON_ID=483371 /ORGANISM="non described non described, Strain CCMP2298" /LENGTH=169 /DNA_ID=CAMNT_0014281243 /DNA_START=1 /DNA_END=510 /DNA_ORIENTATION=+